MGSAARKLEQLPEPPEEASPSVEQAPANGAGGKFDTYVIHPKVPKGWESARGFIQKPEAPTKRELKAANNNERDRILERARKSHEAYKASKKRVSKPREWGIAGAAYQANLHDVLGLSDGSMQALDKQQLPVGARDPRYQETLKARRAEKKQKNPDYGWNLRSGLKNLLFSAAAVLTAGTPLLVGKQGLDMWPHAPRARSVEDNQRVEREWTIHPQSELVAGDPERSPFAGLFRDGYANDSFMVPNRFFGQGDLSLFADLRIDRNTRLTPAGPALLRRLWAIKCSISDRDLTALGEDSVSRYETAVREGRVRRSSLNLEMARIAGWREGGAARGVPYTQTIWEGIRWEEFGRDQGLDKEQTALAQDIARLISPTMIEAIFLTETAGQMSLPEDEAGVARQARQAQVNMHLYDYILREYGAEFANKYPSQGDGEVSLGVGQPTHYVLGPGHSTELVARHFNESVYPALALSDGAGGIKSGMAENPANIDTLPEQRVIAYTNAVYNEVFAIATSQHAREAFTRIRDGANDPATRQLALERLAEFLASHNNPRRAAQMLGDWDAHVRALDTAAALAVPVSRFAPDRNLREYGTSMRFNYDAMEAAFGHLFRQEAPAPGFERVEGIDGVSFPQESARFRAIRERIHREGQ